MSWSTSLPRMKPPCVVKPLHLCSPKATRSRKRRRNSCFHNLNGYLQAARLHGAEVLLDLMEVAVAVMDGLGVEGGLWHVRLKHVTPLQPCDLCLGSGIQQGRELPLVQGDVHERVQLVPLSPGTQGPQPCFGLRPLCCLHKGMAGGEPCVQLGERVGAASRRRAPHGLAPA